jgi:hypothetical protein
MTSKFEQLIEYVINDEEAKAKELFHDIVVEKSREIYENLMTEEEDEEVDESKEEDGEELEEAKHDEEDGEELEEAKEEEMDESMMADETELMNDVEAEEQGMEMQEADGEEGLEDRVVDLEDKLDELMAEFEALMGDEGAEEVGDEMGGDDLEMDDTETADFGMDGEEESDSEEIEMGMMEAVSLSKVAPAKMGDDGANTKSIVPHNSGAKGMAASPVKMTGDTAQGRPAPKTGELIGKVQNSVGGDKKMSAAPKPVTAQAGGVNTKSPVSKA